MGRSREEKRAYRGRGVGKSKKRGTQRRFPNYREERDDPGRVYSGRDDSGRNTSGRDTSGRDTPGRDYSGRENSGRNNSARENKDDAAPEQHEGHGTYYNDIQSGLRHNRTRFGHHGLGGRGGRQSRSRREPRPSHTQDNGGGTIAQLRERHDRLDKYNGYMKQQLEVHPTYAVRDAALLTSAMQGMDIGNGQTEGRHENPGHGDKIGRTMPSEPANKKDDKRAAWASKQQQDYENREAKRQEEAWGAGNEMEVESVR
jgi:hypothetical protein